MSTKSSLQKNNRTLIKTLLMSFAIGFFVITMMIFPIQNPKPEWGENWKIKPLIIVHFAILTENLYIMFL